MTELYPWIKLVHIAAVAASGSLFALRGLLLILDRPWAMARPVRTLSQAIDTLLLAAAITLTVIIGQYPFADAWLTAKVLLLVLYIALGVIAFRKERSKAARIFYWLAALAVFGFIVSVALTHDPRGLFSLL
ncbi:SirB2 family protein [Dongia sp.]|uniref:SirB2 family protein n=1 Tax=Dongia sp. TaxID=1977262 RepID=UPI00375240E9